MTSALQDHLLAGRRAAKPINDGSFRVGGSPCTFLTGAAMDEIMEIGGRRRS